MSSQQLLWMDLTQRLGWALIHSLWEGAAIAMVLSMVLAMLRRATSQARYLASAAGLLALVVSFGLTYGLIASRANVNIPTPPSASPQSDAVISGAPAGLAPPPPQDRDFPLAVKQMRHAVVAETAAQPAVSPSWLATSALWIEPAVPKLPQWWAVGVVLLTLWNIGGWIAAQRLKVLGIRPVSADAAAIAGRLSGNLKLNKPVRVLQSLLAETPVVIGWLRPVVLLPASVLAGLTQGQLEAILAHELAHVRRHDYLVNLFQVAVETLLFYHPAVWWMSRRIRLEREQCCDDVAVSICGDRCAYVESLAALEEVRMAGILALSARGSGKSQLLVRVRRLLGLRNDSPRGTAGATLAAGLLIAAAITTAAWHGRSSRAKADAPVESKVVEGTMRWTATLPSGVEVELIGVADNPSESQPWWKPDGSPLARPYEKLGALSHPDKGQVAREFAVRLSHLPAGDDISTQWRFDGHENSSGAGTTATAAGQSGEIRGITTTFAIAAEVSTVRVGVASGGWKTLAEHAGAKGEVQGSILFGPLIEQDRGGSTISVSHNISGRDVRVVAIDAAGHERTPGETQVQGADGFSQVTVIFPGLASKDVHSFQLQARDYEWAEFKDVALQAGAWRGPARQSGDHPLPGAPASQPAALAAPGGNGGGKGDDKGVCINALGSIARYDRAAPETRGGQGPQRVPVMFTVPEDDVIAIVKRLDAHQPMTVELYNRDLTKVLGQGSLTGIDNQIDPATATLTCKAVVLPVGDALLFPNEFVLVRLYLGPPPAPRDDGKKPTTLPAAAAPEPRKLLLVTKENYWLEREARAVAGEGNVTLMTPDQYEAGLTGGRDVIIFDGYQPKKALLGGAALYFNAVPPDSNLAVTDDRGQAIVVKDGQAVAKSPPDPIVKDLKPRTVFVAEAIKLREAPGWTTLAESQNGPLIVSHLSEGLREIVVAFDVQQSNWPLRSSFPGFIDGALRWLMNAEVETHGERPATQPGGEPHADFVPRLQFRLVAEPGDKSDADEMIDPDGKQPMRVLKAVELDERDVARAYEMKIQGDQSAVGVDFSEAGAKKFEKLTAANIHRRLAIVFKGTLLSAPRIQATISRTAVITPGADGFTAQHLKGLIEAINALAGWRPPDAPPTTRSALPGNRDSEHR